ncbi:unannotated protein [freshwater metagenome]|uniref:Unannotated protein n=1 Tax=freshwater metagenome TaxID=449393 RepID=A0A6J7GK43_9ZZZZ|nr:fibronectin [Actinomycetota bacterium]
MRVRTFLISVGLCLSVLVAPVSNVNALEVKVAPAGWAYIYATGVSVQSPATPRAYATNIDRKSTFVPTYNNVPQIAKESIQSAIDIWSENFISAVPINVSVAWTKSPDDSILASASAKNVFANFAGAPDKTLYYASALANALAGKDLDPSEPELEINVTSDAAWYYGLDGKCPFNKYDLVSVILHEMAHGLGFMSGSYYDPATKVGRIVQPTPFDAYTQLPDGRRLVDMPSPSLETGTAITSTLYWTGENGVKANNGVKPLLYTPARYEFGSSVSHLDEKTFSGSAENAVMTPNLSAGEVFHLPGAIVLGMFADLRLKPPAGKAYALPGPVQNIRALVGDKSAIIKFDPPADFRFSQIENYEIENLVTNEIVNANESPVTISGLKNGIKYTFSVKAKNSAGSSEATKSNQVIPQSAWKSTVIDPNADAKYIAVANYIGKPTIAYSDSKNGDLKLATFSNNKWSLKTIDGDTDSAGKTLNNVAGNISICTSAIGKINYLHIFYTDLTNKDLKYALYNGKSWKYETVDGNGLVAQDYKEVDRVRGASDVSVSNACAIANNTVQVFYRDESQGILLGAVKENGKWKYEIVDGDKDTENRTTGDVAFHLKALAVKGNINLIYDSVKGFDSDRNVTKGEVRYATRSSSSNLDWEYKTLDLPTERIYATGYDVSILNSAKGLEMGWFTATGFTYPNPDQVRYQDLNGNSIISVKAEQFGTISSPISVTDKKVLFSCELRLCAINKSDKSVNLISKDNLQSGSQGNWLTVNKIQNVVAGISGKLTLLKP